MHRFRTSFASLLINAKLLTFCGEDGESNPKREKWKRLQ